MFFFAAQTDLPNFKELSRGSVLNIAWLLQVYE